MPLTYRGRALLYDVGLGQRREARRDTTGTSLTRRHKDVVVSGDFAWRGSCFTNDRDRGQGRTLGLRGERENKTQFSIPQKSLNYGMHYLLLAHLERI